MRFSDHPGTANNDALRARAVGHERGVRAVLRSAAGWAFGSYQLNRVYTLALPPQAAIAAPAGIEIRPILAHDGVSDHPEFGIRRTSSYGGNGAWGYGAWCDGALVAVCWLWSSERCGNGVVRLAPHERALVEIHTHPEFRGRAIAPALISHAATAAARDGCTRLYAWIWWSNTASIRAFEKSGWRYSAFAFSVRLIGRTLTGTWSRKPGA